MKTYEIEGSCNFMIEGADLEKKTVPVILSDESEVVRYDYKGKYFISLKHGDENVNLDRKDILSLFINHDTYELPTGKFENVRLEDNKLKAVAVFDKNDEESMKIFNKIIDGFLQSFSVGINIQEKVLVKSVDNIEYYDITKWELKEASVVGIPAIASAKVGLSDETEKDTLRVNSASAQIENNPIGESMKTYSETEVEALNAQHAEALNTANTDAIALERARVSAIIALGGSSEFNEKAIADGSSAGDAAIALLSDRNEELATAKRDFEAGASEVDGLNLSDKQEVVLSDDEKAEAEALEALDNFGGNK